MICPRINAIEQVSPSHEAGNRDSQSSHLAIEIDGLWQVRWWVAGQISDSKAAIKIFADVISYTATSITAANVGAEHGGTTAAVDVVAPRTHVSARSCPGF